MSEMVKDHTKAVADFEQVSGLAQDADLKSFASQYSRYFARTSICNGY